MEIYTLNDDSGKHGANCSLHEVKMKDLRLMKTLLVNDGLHEMPVLQSTELEYVSKMLSATLYIINIFGRNLKYEVHF